MDIFLNHTTILGRAVGQTVVFCPSFWPITCTTLNDKKGDKNDSAVTILPVFANVAAKSFSMMLYNVYLPFLSLAVFKLVTLGVDRQTYSTTSITLIYSRHSRLKGNSKVSGNNFLIINYY